MTTDLYRVHPFYRNIGAALRVCPGDLHFPGIDGYADHPQTADEVQAALDAGEVSRYCWMLGPQYVVIDVDMHEGGGNGMQSFRQLCRDLEIDLLRECKATVQTPRDGLHLYFRVPAWMQGMRAIDQERYPGIDTLSGLVKRSSLVIAAGSNHRMLPDVRYEFLEAEPELVELPSKLAAMLAAAPKVREGGDLSIRENVGKPGDMFMRSLKGVKLVRDMMAAKGYIFRDCGSYLEFDRPDKTTGSLSGHLGKQSQDGVYQLTSFSLADEHFDSGQSITILEALRRLGPEGTTTKDVVRKLAQMGWGRPKLEDVFKDMTVAAGGEVSEDLPQPIGEFWNYTVTDGTDAKGKAIKIKTGRSLADLVNEIRGGGLCNCNGTLFVRNGEDKVQFLEKASELFGWIQRYARVMWGKSVGMTTKEEFHAEILHHVPHYSSIERTPHYPPIPDCFYLHDPEKVGDVADLYEFVDHFSPETDIDRQLILAAVVTAFWGGAGGGRPLFIITSEGGVGAGKSTLVHSISRLVNLGASRSIQIRRKKDFEDLPRTIGSLSADDPTSHRIIQIDNYSGSVLAAADIESMLTEPVWGVWKLYAGNVQVPNLFTWFLTTHAVDLSPDLASRMVHIKVRKPESYNSQWSEKLANWDLEKVMLGIAAFFQLPRSEMTETTRFVPWSRDVLGRMKNPDNVVAEILRRAEVMNIANDDAMDLKDALLRYVKSGAELDSEGRAILYPKRISGWLNIFKEESPTGKPWNSRSLGRMMKMHAKTLKLEPFRTATTRGFLWDVKLD